MNKDPIFQLLKIFESAYNSRDWSQLQSWFHENVNYTDAALKELRSQVSEGGEKSEKAYQLLNKFKKITKNEPKIEFNGKKEFRNFIESLWIQHPKLQYSIIDYSFGVPTFREINGVKGPKIIMNVGWVI